jgi:hypothetical protein
VAVPVPPAVVPDQLEGLTTLDVGVEVVEALDLAVGDGDH